MEVGIDVTEQMQAQQALHKAHDELETRVRERTRELEAANRELESFSYSVSHDLRAPLRSLEGFSTALLDDYAGQLDDQAKQYLRYIRESSVLMARLIDDLLKLSRITRSEMTFEKVDLSEMAWNIVAKLRKTEPQREAEVIIASEIAAYGDHNLLRVVLENLLDNAWKFTGKTARARIEFGVTEQNGRRVYFMRDNGAGFDMKYADKLFQPFQRLHRASEFPGTGIGLATVQRIIRRHGGTVRAEGKAGEGAAFYFTLGE
jgi:light-regulated signal transduction histidine kinase (bacteriophytochrome)